MPLSWSNNTTNQPFEWLTSPASLSQCLSDAILQCKERPSAGFSALHVGCGTSTLGELLLMDPSLHISSVVNTDSDSDALEAAAKRWRERCCRGTYEGEPLEMDSLKRMEFRKVDYSAPSDECDDDEEEFDLVVDKSTLDCLLCTDAAASNMLCSIYNSLRVDGVYVLVSFHHVDFLKPLVEDLPGSFWETSFLVVKRQVESLERNSGPTQRVPVQPTLPLDENRKDKVQSTWSNGTFSPDEGYRQTVNVLLCRKRSSRRLDRQSVYNHVHKTNDEWYSRKYPMATQQRQSVLAQSFQDGNELDLNSCYQVLFTDAERDHYDQEDFQSDWTAFLSIHAELPKDRMSFDTAVAFLKEMQ